MNLLEEAFIPVRLIDGSHAKIAPVDIGRPDVAGLAAVRADFNGALAQFAIGLLQTGSPVDGLVGWRRRLDAPPAADELRTWFAPYAAAFELDVTDARFMQDRDLRSGDGEALSIGNLLIEAPGENAVKNNTDHFIKRGLIQKLCPHCAAVALFTLQVNGPAGGVGYRTGVRGGGPLTTLLVAHGEPAAPRSLWTTLWLNVLPRDKFLAATGPHDRTALHDIFPWCGSLADLQRDGGQITPAQTHPAHVYWAMPSRIRLDFDAVGHGVCDLCGEASFRLVASYTRRNYGLNYKGAWTHPLSPYYQTKEGMLPVHPQPDGLGYRHWLGWVLGVHSDRRKVRRASAVEAFFDARTERRAGIPVRIWAFGYDMDNAKVRCWYEATMPLYGLQDCDIAAQQSVREDVATWLAGVDLACDYLRGAVKDAWFGGEARGNLSFVEAMLSNRTMAGFYSLLQRRIGAARSAKPFDLPGANDGWHDSLRREALRLFDAELVGGAPVERVNPARIAAARRQLERNLDGRKLRSALMLPERRSTAPGSAVAETADASA